MECTSQDSTYFLSAQVDPVIPGEFSLLEYSKGEDCLIAVQAVFGYMRTRLATVCWNKNLLQSNRARLYSDVTDAILSSLRNPAPCPQPRVQFKV